MEEGSEKLVGLGRVELPTSPLSGVRSSQLSYRPNGIATEKIYDLFMLHGLSCDFNWVQPRPFGYKTSTVVPNAQQFRA